MFKSLLFITFLSGLATASLLSHTFANRGISLHPPFGHAQSEYSTSHKHLPLGRRTRRHPAPESWSNAKRLAEGFAPKPPVRRTAARGLASPSPSPSPSPTISQPPTSNTPSSSPSDTPTSSSSQPSATPDPVFTQGHLACTNLDTGVFAGYVSRNLNSYGEYMLTESSANRIQIEIDLDAAQAGPVDITLINGSTLPTYPFLGAISGFANADYNLGPGSYHYAYLGGVTQSAPGAPAVEQDNSFTAATGSTVGTESAIWRYNPVTQEVTPTWVNVDGSLPSVSLFYDSGSEAFVITADRAEFENVFGNTGTLYECALSFEAATLLY